MCAATMCILYPGTVVMCLSSTARKATLILRKLSKEARNNANLYNEILPVSARRPIRITDESGLCRFRNGSEIVAMALQSVRGERAKILILDEVPEIKLSQTKEIFMPVRNYTREVCIANEIPDFPSKVVMITSACLKSNDFYTDFVKVAKDMSYGNRESFVMALDYNFAVRAGITPAAFFEEERRTMDQSKFDMEYGSIFMGAAANSVFPYELTEPCRTLEFVELRQPKDSTSKYVIAVDIAKSSSGTADNTVISVIKMSERPDGSYARQLVNMRTYFGNKLEETAMEIRRYLARFPNAVRVVFDTVGIGESIPEFLNKPWVDPETGKEHPPLVLDTEMSFLQNARPILHAFRGNVASNQKLVNNLRVALEKRTLQLPIQSRNVKALGLVMTDEELNESDEEPSSEGTLSMAEQAIYYETDALQIEMGNLVATVSASGAYTYGTAKESQKKDRYSSLAMGNNYISEIEADKMKRNHSWDGGPVIGVATDF